MRIVFDTNLLIAALANPGGTSAGIVERWRAGELTFVTSKATLREAELVLRGGWVTRIASPSAREALLGDLHDRGARVDAPALADLPALKDEGDRRLVEAAIAGSARYVVTSDREVLLHRGYASVEFVTPGEMRSLLVRA